MSHDWIPRHKAQTFPLRDFYVDLKWSRQVRRAMQSTKQSMETINDVLQIPEAGEKPFNIIIEGMFCHTIMFFPFCIRLVEIVELSEFN